MPRSFGFSLDIHYITLVFRVLRFAFASLQISHDSYDIAGCLCWINMVPFIAGIVFCTISHLINLPHQNEYNTSF
jgi:hypothetical protein